ncbi:ketopantoate reductase family protein [Leptospira bouyouniensis]|uniref:2-dehydropantoate 2-reductase n=1 Tax=Leptospira bouyouniensis TaxID=2484911 RepID=A0A7I0IMP9_9LEPT|nr:ketopantoate reductase C-terminal domain-containing protein [Leptospira bouyouniensis]TGK52450.1 ketopantoate reductase family protein [Leptospira bouyouniensis]TGL04750.1 ketopantoate reductase family protein [Leptospira bouyouniensis]
MKEKFPTIAICGIGSVTVTILHAFHQNKVPFKILCQNQMRLDSLKEKPIQFKGPNGITTSINLTDHLTLIQDCKHQFDFIILGCKNQSLNDYLSITDKFLNSDGKWILIQNGLPESYYPSLGNKLIGGVVGWNTQVLQDGTYFQSNHGSLIIGGIQQIKLNPIWISLLNPWIEVIITESILGYRWHKLAINAIINGLAASKQISLGELFLNIEGRREAICILSEIKNLMDHLNIKEGVVPGSFPIKKLGDGIGALPNWIRHLILIFLGLKYYKIRTSMVQDLDNKRKTEINYINGEVVKIAKLENISVPWNTRILNQVLKIESEF